MKLTFVTSHPKKAEELAIHLKREVAHVNIDLQEIQSLDIELVVREKALQAYEMINRPVLVEDVSFQYHALGKLPGPLFKWFLEELEVKGLCNLLDNYQDRTVTAQVAFAIAINEDEVKTFLGEMKGTIAPKPRGNSGFGADSIFIPEGWEKTWGEMTKEEQITTSVRRIGLAKLEKFLVNREN